MIKVRNRQNLQEQQAWIGNQNYIRNGYQFMMCRWSDKEKRVVPFCERFYETYAAEGLDNSQYLINSKFKAIKYFKTLVKYFHNKGYEDYKNLFIFGFDWRQPTRNTAYELDQYIKYVYEQNGRRCVLIAHSLGNVLVDSYLKQFDDFNHYVKKFISIAPPYNGLGYISPLMILTGYDMQCPLPQSCCRQIQLGSACMVEMNSIVNGGIIYFKQSLDMIEQQQQELLNWNDVKFSEINEYILPYEIALRMKKENYQLYFNEFIILQSFCKKGLIIHRNYEQKQTIDMFLWMEQQLKKIKKKPCQQEDYAMQQYSNRRLYKLNKLIYPDKTILGYLCQIQDSMINYINDVKDQYIDFDNKDFEIYIYGSYGVKTYKDIQVNEIVYRYEDLPKMNYSFTKEYGDGTVPLQSVMYYSYPDKVIKDVCIKNNVSHTDILYTKDLQEKISQWLL